MALRIHRIWDVSILIFFFVLTASFSQKDVQGKIKLYESEACSISYPSDWKLSTKMEPLAKFVIYHKVKNKNGTVPTVMFHAYDLVDSIETLTSYDDKHERIRASMFKDYKLESQTFAFESAGPVIKKTFSYEDMGERTFYSTHIRAVGDQIYVLTFNVAVVDLELYREAGAQIMKSFKLKLPGGPEK